MGENVACSELHQERNISNDIRCAFLSSMLKLSRHHHSLLGMRDLCICLCARLPVMCSNILKKSRVMVEHARAVVQRLPNLVGIFGFLNVKSYYLLGFTSSRHAASDS